MVSEGKLGTVWLAPVLDVEDPCLPNAALFDLIIGLTKV